MEIKQIFVIRVDSSQQLDDQNFAVAIGNEGHHNTLYRLLVTSSTRHHNEINFIVSLAQGRQLILSCQLKKVKLSAPHSRKACKGSRRMTQTWRSVKISGQPHAMAFLSQANSLMYPLNRSFGVRHCRRFVKPTSDRLSYTVWQKFTDVPLKCLHMPRTAVNFNQVIRCPTPLDSRPTPRLDHRENHWRNLGGG